MKPSLMLTIALALPMAAVAQVSPVPPRPPAPAPRPRVAPRPIEPLWAPMPPMPPMPMDIGPMDVGPLVLGPMDIGPIDVGPLDLASLELLKLHDFDLRARDLEMRAQELAHLDMPAIMADAERSMQELAHLDMTAIVGDAGRSMMDAQRAMLDAERAMVHVDRAFPGLVPSETFGGVAKLLDARPRAPWAQEDPADSLYRLAREALNRGEYRRAATLFNEITRKYKTSEYAQDCAYWEAFSRYRLGGTEDLKQALRILEGKGEVQIRFASSRDSGIDVPALRARVQGALAARGDKEAEQSLVKEARENGGCDRENISVKSEALRALGQMDMQAAMPVVKKVLANRDECTVELRRSALYLVGRQGDAEAATVILDVAKNDTDPGIRGEAMRWLPRVAGDRAVPQLEELLRTSTDEHAQRSAIAALASINSDVARRAVRAIIERTDASERVRADAVISLSRDREDRPVSGEDLAYMRGLYSKLDNPRLREAVLTSLSRVETPENVQFLLGIARNVNETFSLRAAAMQRLGRMSSVGVNEIAKLYDVADARSLREQVLYALSQRKEPEAIDKLIEIARKDTDPQIRRSAINLLARSNNPKAKQILAELIDR